MEIIGKVRAEQAAVQRFVESYKGHQDIVSEEMHEWASRHAESSGGLLVVLDNDHDRYPDQRLSKLYFNGELRSPEEVSATARLAEPNFDAILDRLAAYENAGREISRLGEDLEAGQKIILVTNHGHIKDIVIALAAFYVALSERGYQFETSLIMSKMISHLGFLTTTNPAIDVLKIGCSRGYLSFPRTSSTEGSKIADGLISAYNGTLRQIIKLHQRKGGNLFAMAPSGTTDKALDPDKPNEYTLGRIGPSAKLMIGKEYKVVPVAIWLNDDEPVFEICDIPRSLADEEEADGVMQLIATTLNEHVAGKEFVYRPDTYQRSMGDIAIRSQ